MSPLKFCLAEISVSDMVDMDVKLCNKISKFQMPDSEAGPWACPKLSNYVTVQSDQVRNQLLKISCRNIIRISNRLDPDLARRNVVLDLGLKCTIGFMSI